MLAFERRVTAALTTTADPTRRAAIEACVDGTLRDMPELLRVGVAAQSALLGVMARVFRVRSAERIVDAVAESPIVPLRQYVRLFRSLVLFAELELEPQAGR